MKKNLIGIVAAGLALALAFTGCESGSDSPVKYATDLDNPVTKGSKFTYVANPTEYTYAAASTDTLEGAVKTDNKGWAVTRYVGGKQSFTRLEGESSPYKDVSKSDPKVGDVLNTKSETIVLDSATNTFTLDEASSNYEVKGIREKLTTASTPASTATSGQNNDSYVTLPFYFSPTDSTTFAADTTASSQVTNNYMTQGAVNTTGLDTVAKKAKAVADIFGDTKTAGTVLYVAALDVATKKAAFDTAYTGGSVANKLAFDQKDEDGKKTDPKFGTEYKAWDDAKTAQANAVAAKAAAEYYIQGATIVITDTVTKSGATTGSENYYTALDRKVLVKSVDKKGGTAKSKYSGSYTLSGSSYKSATVTVTTLKEGDNTYVFNTDGTYTLNGELMGTKADEAFPKYDDKSDGTTVGNKLNSAYRKFTIADGTITTARFRSTAKNSPEPALIANNSFFANASWVTYADAKTDGVITTTGKTEKKTSYSYKLSN